MPPKQKKSKKSKRFIGPMTFEQYKASLAPKPQKSKTPKKKVPRPPQMSECARKYMAALARPFSEQAFGCCLPYEPDRASLKAHAIMRFNLPTAAVTGDAFVMIAPTIFNDKKAVWYSSSTTTIPFAVTTVDTAPAGVSSLAPTGLPFGNATISGIAGRVVSVGLRVTYTAAASAMAGVWGTYVEPEHGNVNTTDYSITNVLTSVEAKTARISDRPFEQGFGITSPTEQAYRGFPDARQGQVTAVNVSNVIGFYPWSRFDINTLGPGMTGYLLNGSAPILFYISGGPPSTNFWVEVIFHVEYVGKLASYGLTPSHNDHNAANAIDSAAMHATTNFAQSTSSWDSNIQRAFRAANVIGRAYRAYRGYRRMAPPSGALALTGH